MEQIIPDNENIEDYFTGDEVDEWSSLEDSYEFGTLGEFRDALNRWVDDIYREGSSREYQTSTHHSRWKTISQDA